MIHTRLSFDVGFWDVGGGWVVFFWFCFVGLLGFVFLVSGFVGLFFPKETHI